MNLVPKTTVLCAALAALALFVGAFIAAIARARGGLLTWGSCITLAQYVFLAWKEGFTRSGDWHAFVFLWFLPLGVAFCFLRRPAGAPARFSPVDVGCRLRRQHGALPGGGALSDSGFRLAASCRLAAARCPQRRDDPCHLYAGARTPSMLTAAMPEYPMLLLDHAKDVIGNESVDVMNYLLLAAVVNEMNYQPRPVIQGFVAYTPALQSLNEEYFRSAGRPHFVMLCQQATDGRFPALEDSAALNYVLNNYVPVARDGRFLILQQRTAEDPAFQLVHEETLRFGEKLDLRPWAQRPLFMSVDITPSLLGRAATLLYQQHPLYMRVARDQVEERYRIVPSMAERPFLVNPLLNSNYDVMNLYASQPGKAPESVTFERPAHGTL